MSKLADIVSVESIKLACKRLSPSKKPGVDGQTVEQLRDLLKLFADDIVASVLDGSFVASPLLKVLIPKGNSEKMRTIYLPVSLDKAIQLSIVSKMTATTEAIFHDSSFGFRPGRSRNIQCAVQRASVMVKEGYLWCLTIDIKSFFDGIERERLRRLLREYNLGIDGPTRSLINQFITAPIQRIRFREPSRGVPAGLPLAPLLANIYLTPFDRYLDKCGHPFVRYADDIAVFFRDESECRRFEVHLSNVSEKDFGFSLNVEKTNVVTGRKRRLLGHDIDDLGRITASAAVFEKTLQNLYRLLADFDTVRPVGGLGSVDHERVTKFAKDVVSRFNGVLSAFRAAENLLELEVIANHHVEMFLREVCKKGDLISLTMIAKVKISAVDELLEFDEEMAVHELLKGWEKVRARSRLKAA